MEITKNIHQLKHNFKISLDNGLFMERFVNSLIIFDKEITLIDSGTSSSYKKIKNYIEARGRSIHDVKRLILSHSHPDHIGSAYRIKNECSCTVYSHMMERSWIEDIDLQVRNRPVPGFLKLTDRAVKVDEVFQGGEIIDLGEVKIEIIHTPGHSPGSLNILFRKENILFTADSIPLKGDIPNYNNFKELLISMAGIKSNYPYKGILSSWNEPLFSEKSQRGVLEEGLKYLELLDSGVKTIYTESEERNNINNCRKVVELLKLPKFMVNPVVHRAFLSHF